MVKVTRKRRSDRKHVIYCAVNVLSGDFYIGLTVVSGQAIKKSVKVRWQKHVSRAKCEAKEWSMCAHIREWGPECFDLKVLDVVRGRKPAHQAEREFIRRLQPTLNTF